MITFVCRHGSNCVQNAKRILKILPIRFLFCFFLLLLFFAHQFCFVEFHAIASYLVAPTTTTTTVIHDVVCPLRFCVLLLLNAWQNVVCSKYKVKSRQCYSQLCILTVCILRAKIQKVIDILNTLKYSSGWAFLCAQHSTAQHCKIQHCRPTITENIIITLCTRKF